MLCGCNCNLKITLATGLLWVYNLIFEVWFEGGKENVQKRLICFCTNNNYSTVISSAKM
jgi:hypothetical protein